MGVNTGTAKEKFHENILLIHLFACVPISWIDEKVSVRGLHSYFVVLKSAAHRSM